MLKKLWIDPIFGASGDMLLSLLVGLGAPLEKIEQGLKSLPLQGWRLQESEVSRCGLDATHVQVTAEESHHHRKWSDIDALIAQADFSEYVATGARKTFKSLGESEAKVHQCKIDDVHFHEVGAVDAIVDIVGVWLALDHLELDEILSGPVGLGQGLIQAAHGKMSAPTPATLNLLEGWQVNSLDFAGESITPTGAALLTTFAKPGPMPKGKLVSSHRGAGTRNPETHANVVTGVVIEERSASQLGAETENVIELATNLDDVTPEVIAHTQQVLLEAGALDVWLVPLHMKKGRPGFCLKALAAIDTASDLQQIIFEQTGTLGVRSQTLTRQVLPRSFESIEYEGEKVSIKHGPHKSKPEYEDMAAVSRSTGRPLREIKSEVE